MHRVGISDKVGHTNTTLIMRTCDQDGNLLQPSKPLTPSDRMFTEIGEAGDCATCRGELPQDGSSAQIWSTYSTVGETTVWYTVGLGIGSNPHGHHVPADIPLPLRCATILPAFAAWAAGPAVASDTRASVSTSNDRPCAGRLLSWPRLVRVPLAARRTSTRRLLPARVSSTATGTRPASTARMLWPR
jgi:hypothetical protein